MPQDPECTRTRTLNAPGPARSTRATRKARQGPEGPPGPGRPARARKARQGQEGPGPPRADPPDARRAARGSAHSSGAFAGRAGPGRCSPRSGWAPRLPEVGRRPKRSQEPSLARREGGGGEKGRPSLGGDLGPAQTLAQTLEAWHHAGAWQHLSKARGSARAGAV